MKKMIVILAGLLLSAGMVSCKKENNAPCYRITFGLSMNGETPEPIKYCGDIDTFYFLDSQGSPVSWSAERIK